MDIVSALSNMLCLILQVTNDESFPAPLNQAEEAKMLALLENGDNSAKEKLIEHNLRLVAHIIKKYYSNYAEQDDLISIGTIGLIKGINSYKAAKGTKLATYCSRCIENEILMHFRSCKKISQEISISEPIDTDGEGNPMTLMEIISSENDIIDDIDTKTKIIKLVKLVDKIEDKRDRLIIIRRYGLDGNEPMTQKEIADRLKISRSYVSRIEKRILENLKSHL